MSIVLELSIPGSDLSFGSLLDIAPEIRIRFDRVVPIGDGLFSYVWVNVPDQATFEGAMQRHSIAESFRFLQRENGECLYRVNWQPKTDPFLRCLGEVDAAVLRARGVANRWYFDLRFDTHDDVNHFQRRCSEQDVSISIERVVHESAGGQTSALLTPCQRQTIALALERGYFDVPRRTTMVELADELGVSDQAVSARIRRAMKRLGQQALSDVAELDTTQSRSTRL
ncbi:helix-turn-helix domain-containing protein [Halapricum desulfuricans]|uniref:Transcriptional regulator, contains HTH domain n=1 Tax=Halapricum desulfuricans TaxID=2841257 RepID=A0A897NLZ0_9EURY|nr:helix-turn-helix domain-containing protein [Halapricum desulfuricans]QSG15510.1 Transcriptional regulator, contains HTH domain [Halapricum desulfuricans]